MGRTRLRLHWLEAPMGANLGIAAARQLTDNEVTGGDAYSSGAY
jgi:hypothetical protein